MKTDTDIVKACALYVAGYFAKNLDVTFLYHNLSHTGAVAKAVGTLCSVMRVEEHQKKILLISAWFHDLGFTKQIQDHEEIGAGLAEEFLRVNGVKEKDIAMVRSCILATCYPQKPTTLMEQIICDADLMYLGENGFVKTSGLLRKEWELTKSLIYTDEEWYRMNIQFVSSHHFHTPFCYNNVEKKKDKNVKLLLARLQHVSNKKAFLLENRAGKGLESKFKRGVESFFRTATGKQMKLTGLYYRHLL